MQVIAGQSTLSGSPTATSGALMERSGRRYEIGRVLGSGGHGTVFHARYVGEGEFAKDVALKVLNREFETSPELAARLRDEARVLGMLRHRAIVRVDRLTQLNGQWAVVMEYVDGVDLSQIVKSGPVPPAVALEIVSEVAGALHAAATCPGPSGAPLQLLHRDLKPSNIRLTAFGEVKILDFGIARAQYAAREAQTRTSFFGTVEYMSPERLDFQDASPASDIYSLGLVLVELLTGVRHRTASARRDRHDAALSQIASTLDALADAPPGLTPLVLSILSYDPLGRPTAAEVERRVLALSRSGTGEPLRAWAERHVPPLISSPAAPNQDGRPLHLPNVVWEDPSTPPGLATSSTPPPPIAPRARGPARRLPLVAIVSAVALLSLSLLAGSVVLFGIFVKDLSGKGLSAAIGPSLPDASASTISAPVADEPGSGHSLSVPAAQEPATSVEGDDPSLTSGSDLEAAPLPEGPPDATTPEAKRPSSPSPAPQKATSNTRIQTPTTVIVVGDATALKLTGPRGTINVPTGQRLDVDSGPYEVRVTFPGRRETGSRAVVLTEGVAHILLCEAVKGSCELRK